MSSKSLVAVSDDAGRGHSTDLRHRLPFSVSRSGVKGWGLVFGVRYLVVGVWGMGFKVWGLRFGVWGLGFRVEGSGFLDGPAETRDVLGVVVAERALEAVAPHPLLDLGRAGFMRQHVARALPGGANAVRRPHGAGERLGEPRLFGVAKPLRATPREASGMNHLSSCARLVRFACCIQNVNKNKWCKK